jgi:MoaA/NifB/PqqE/SkfB family radical SAM enzyme
MRQHTEFLVLTGGEPTQHPEFRRVLTGLKDIRFRGVILTTNGLTTDHYLDEVAGSIHYLVFSLQAMHSGRGDAGYGRKGTHERVLANIDRAARHPKRKYEIIISSVLTPDNIPDMYEVYDYARKHGFRLAVCPQLLGVKAAPGLACNPEYERFFDFLISEKKRGASIQGTVDYLQYMRDLRKFSCHPFTMLVVSPAGNVFYPCLELGQFTGNLFDEPNLHALRQRGLERLGPQPGCDTQCHSACALGFSRLLQNPGSLCHEAMLISRSRMKRLF